MRVCAEAKGLSLALEYEGNVPNSIQTDPYSLRQILVNLIGNAIKFTESGGVRVVLRLDAGGGNQSLLHFDVIDTGIGLSEEQIELLFQPFSQADSSMHRRFGGTGLGLAISRRLALLLGGDITVTSVPDKGSAFSIAVETGPLDGVKLLDHPSGIEQPRSQAPFAEPKLNCRILLAEDGPDNQRLISFILYKAGAEVTVAENGKVAVDLALASLRDNNPFDVIVMDMQMPVMDGYEATRILRNTGYKKPIVALTAQAMLEDHKNCINAGCDAYLSKPIDRIDLIKSLQPYAVKETCR